MRRLLAVVLSTLALGTIPAAAHAQAGPTTSVGSFTMWNPCTGEEVAVTATYHYLAWRHGDLTHTSDGTGTGLSSGTLYRYVWQFTETSSQFGAVEHLISQGSGSDMTRLIDYSDPEGGEVVTCS